MTIAETFAGIASAAMALDLSALRATIHATLDDGLRAASYDGPGGRSADVSSHPERAALNPRTDPGFADLDRITFLEQRFVTAIAELARRSHSHGVPRDWDEAVQDAHLLAEMDAVGVLDRTGQKPARWVLLAGDSVHDLEVIARRHIAGRKPTEDEQNWHDGSANVPVCVWHQAVHERHRRPRLAGKNICAECAQVAEWAGQRPPVWFMEAMIDRDAKPKAYDRALSRLADELGVPAHRRVG